MKWRRIRLICFVAAAAVLVGVVIVVLLSRRDRVSVRTADFAAPGVVLLAVNSCGTEPEAEVTEVRPGVYEVEVRKTQRGFPGSDCLDLVEFTVDPSLASVEVIDEVGGEVFSVPSMEEPEPTADVEGVWEMVEVNGEAVVLGVNTAAIPRFEIRGGLLSGQLGCNNASWELLVGADSIRGAGGEGDAQLCEIPEGSGQMVATERTMSTILGSDEGADVERDGDQMTWRTPSDTVSFELVAP